MMCGRGPRQVPRGRAFDLRAVERCAALTMMRKVATKVLAGTSDRSGSFL
jgi:hypothetical protein